VNLIFGAVINPEMKDEIQITVIATGFAAVAKRQTGGGQAVGNVIAAPGKKTLEFPVRTFETQEELDIPAFLRKRVSS
jgi:cell division protein FtsZ